MEDFSMETIDTRGMTEEQFRALGTTPSYKFLEKLTGDIWEAVKLLADCRLILWDGRNVSANVGDYVVHKRGEEPRQYGQLAYFVHETRTNFVTIRC